MTLSSLTVRRGVLALLLLTGLIYASSLDGGFVWDDEYIYLDNPTLWQETIKTSFLSGNPLAFLRGKLGYDVYRPLQVLAHTWLARIFGLQPFGLHLASVALHAAAGVMVFFLALEIPRRAGPQGAAPARELWAAWLAAALFIAHPLHVEAVAWMAAFSEVLAGLLMLVSLFALLRGTPAPGGVEARGPGAWLAIGYVAAALAFLTKETTLALPLLAVCFVGRRALPLFAIAGAALLARSLAVGLAAASLPSRSPLRHGELMASAALHYFRKLFWPWPLAPEYHLAAGTLVWALFAAGCAALVFPAVRNRAVRVALLLMALPLLPAIAGAMVFPALRLAQDRFAYVAVAGVALLFGCAARYRGGFVLALAVLVVWTALSLAAIQHWRDSEALWTHTLRVTPNSKTAVLGLGSWYFSIQQFGDAERIYDYGLRHRPQDPDYLISRDTVRRHLVRISQQPQQPQQPVPKPETQPRQ